MSSDLQFVYLNELANFMIIIGIDVSKSKLDIWDSNNKFKVIDNQESAIADYFLSFKKDYSTVRIILEATGKYHRLAHQILSDMGFDVMVINPYQSRNFAKAMNLNCKTDKVDARMLCSYGQAMEFENTKVLDPEQELLVELSRRKEQLQGDLVREANRLKVAHKELINSIEHHINFLKQQISDIDNQLNEAVVNNPELKQKLDILTSVPGIGKISALTLIAQLPELGFVSRRQISSLTALAPINNDSGKMKGRRSINNKGRIMIRRSLYMPILSAIRNNPTIKKFYHHLKQQGKESKVAIIACMRKLITILNLMLKNNTKWNLAS